MSTEQRRLNGSDLGSLFGGKRKKKPKTVPGLKKRKIEESIEEITVTKIALHAEPAPSTPVDSLESAPKASPNKRVSKSKAKASPAVEQQKESESISATASSSSVATKESKTSPPKAAPIQEEITQIPEPNALLEEEQPAAATPAVVEPAQVTIVQPVAAAEQSMEEISEISPPQESATQEISAAEPAAFPTSDPVASEPVQISQVQAPVVQPATPTQPEIPQAFANGVPAPSNEFPVQAAPIANGAPMHHPQQIPTPGVPAPVQSMQAGYPVGQGGQPAFQPAMNAPQAQQAYSAHSQAQAPQPMAQNNPQMGMLAQQMVEFANNQQQKWQDAQERKYVLARKRQFGFLAPSALLNLMESVAVLWRQETEERMTSKEMFIEGGLMMVETRLQALRSYGIPEDQLQALERKMQQLKNVL